MRHANRVTPACCGVYLGGVGAAHPVAHVAFAVQHVVDGNKTGKRKGAMREKGTARWDVVQLYWCCSWEGEGVAVGWGGVATQ